MEIKGISTVIASVLMLMIVIALGGTTYLFISNTFTSKTATAFEVINEVNGTVTIRNIGTETISKITATLDGDPVKIAVIPKTNPITNGLVAYYKMNEGSGSTTSDNSGNGNTGTLKPSCPNCPSWDNGVEDKALRFDGVDDYVGINIPQYQYPNGYSLCLWAKKLSTRNAWDIILGRWDTTAGVEHLSWQNSGDNRITIYFAFSDGTSDYVSNPAATELNRWYFICAIYDGNIKLYIDGNLANSKYVGKLLGYQNLELRIGMKSSGYYPSNSIVDEVMVFNRALSASEIQQLYSGLVSPGELATIKPLTSLTKGTHTLRLCTSSMCSTAILTII
ncbi:MAG: LamG-like jellyroll fold domain-containing protein [Candidatus Aenigmatarchaeota archaeon]